MNAWLCELAQPSRPHHTCLYANIHMSTHLSAETHIPSTRRCSVFAALDHGHAAAACPPASVAETAPANSCQPNSAHLSSREGLAHVLRQALQVVLHVLHDHEDAVQLPPDHHLRALRPRGHGHALSCQQISMYTMAMKMLRNIQTLDVIAYALRVNATCCPSAL